MYKKESWCIKVYKYNVGDKVVYKDIMNNEQIGVIEERSKTDNKKINIYLINNYEYLRYEEEIIKKI